MKASIIVYIYNDTGRKFLCSLLKSMAIINNCFPFIYIIVNIMKTNKNEELGKDQCKKFVGKNKKGGCIQLNN